MPGALCHRALTATRTEEAHKCILSGLIVLTLEGDRIAGVTRFGDSGTAARFGMPRTLPID